MPCEKKRVNDYGAAPEAAQWNGSMDEPPVASLANQPLTQQGIFDNLCRCIRYIKTHTFYSDHRFFSKFELHLFQRENFLAKVLLSSFTN